MLQTQAEKIVSEVFSLYEKFGAEDYIGEPVSQTEHMTQAALLAEVDGYDDEVILAAFFHDIGHLCEHLVDTDSMNGYGVVDHELLAGTYLRSKGFSEKIARLAESHVKAKRYLTFKYVDYYNKLSEASKITLAQQGGVMDELEAQNFETDSLHPLYIKLRQWDDAAKLQSIPLPSLEKYKQMAISHLLAQN